jgi:hypothetical protein
MSVIIFDLTEQHIKVVKELNWGLSGNFITTQKTSEHTSSFETTTNYEAIDLILNGKKEIADDCFEDECFSDEEKELFDKILKELPMAIDVIMFTGEFKPGKYKTKYHIRDWKKI